MNNATLHGSRQLTVGSADEPTASMEMEDQVHPSPIATASSACCEGDGSRAHLPDRRHRTVGACPHRGGPGSSGPEPGALPPEGLLRPDSKGPTWLGSKRGIGRRCEKWRSHRTARFPVVLKAAVEMAAAEGEDGVGSPDPSRHPVSFETDPITVLQPASMTPDPTNRSCRETWDSASVPHSC
jgi:hypothetical protein